METAPEIRVEEPKTASTGADANIGANASQSLPPDADATSTAMIPAKGDHVGKGHDDPPTSAADVVAPDKLTDFFFFDGAKIFGLLQATSYSDYEPHEIPAEVIKLEPTLGQYLFAKRPDGGIGIVARATRTTIGRLKYRDVSVTTK